MVLAEMFEAVLAFMKAHPLIALAVCGIILIAFYRRPGLSFFILAVIILLAAVYYVIMSMSSSAVSEKERLLKKGAAPEETVTIDPSRILR